MRIPVCDRSSLASLVSQGKLPRRRTHEHDRRIGLRICTQCVRRCWELRSLILVVAGLVIEALELEKGL